MGLATEQNGGSEFVLIEVESAEDTRVVKGFENLELLECRSTDSLVGRLVLASNRVETHTTQDAGSWVLGLKILVSEERILFDQFLENVITNTPLAR